MPLTTTSWVIPTGTLCLPLNRGDHPTPVLGRHPYSYPFHVQRLHPRKGLFGIHLDTALLAFAHFGARHDTPPQSSFGWGRLRPTTLARFGARRVSLSGRGLAGRDSYPPLCAARRAARLSHAGARESVHASSTRGTRTPYTPLRRVARHAAPGDTSPADLPLKARSAMRGTTPRQETETVHRSSNPLPPLMARYIVPAPCSRESILLYQAFCTILRYHGAFCTNTSSILDSLLYMFGLCGSTCLSLLY